MMSIKRMTIGGAILISSLLMVSACSSVSNVNRTPGATTSTTVNIVGGSSSTTSDRQDAKDSQSNPHGSVTSSEVAIRGVIEGFYGTPWSNQERMNMFQFMQKENLNTYVYAPKNDPYQRLDWRTPYPSSQLLQMKTLVQSANQDNVNFVYSISPGMTGLTASEINDSITYSSAMDRANLESKIDQLRSIGVDTFALSFDDILTKLKPADQSAYGTSYMKAQMDLANAVYAYEKSKDPNFQLWFVPTSYYGLVDGPYWQTLRSKLNQSIQVFWTGKWVLNQTITTSQVQTITNLLGRKPIIWDNYPVNDYTYVQNHTPELFMGPFEGRDVTLPNAVSGYLSNPMIQPYASKLSLMTLSMYLQNPKSYNPVSAWNEAVQKMPGITDPSLFKEFATYVTISKVDSNGLSPMNALISAYRNATTPTSKKQADQNLYDEFKQLSDLPKTLPPTITDKVLLNEIQPWLAKLGEEGQGGLDALAVINQPNQINKNQLASQIKVVTASPYGIGSNIITFMQWAENQ